MQVMESKYPPCTGSNSLQTLPCPVRGGEARFGFESGSVLFPVVSCCFLLFLYNHHALLWIPSSLIYRPAGVHDRSAVLVRHFILIAQPSRSHRAATRGATTSLGIIFFAPMSPCQQILPSALWLSLFIQLASNFSVSPPASELPARQSQSLDRRPCQATVWRSFRVAAGRLYGRIQGME